MLKLVLSAKDVRPHIHSTIQKTITFNQIERMLNAGPNGFNRFVIDFIAECDRDYHHFHNIDFTLSQYGIRYVEKVECSISKKLLESIDRNKMCCYTQILTTLLWGEIDNYCS